MSDQRQPAPSRRDDPTGLGSSDSTPVTTAPTASNPGAHGVGALGDREETTAAELAQLDPQLASLFRLGHDAARSDDSGAVYMLAHAGRELGRGVVRLLATPGAGGETLTEGAAPPDNEKNRTTIAEVLQTQPNHVLVTAWFRLNKIFSDSAHYRNPGPSLQQVRKAYLDFSDLLFGRVAPYFTTHAELERLIALEKPDGNEMQRVRTLLTRHVQRQHFFATLASDGWLDPLASAGLFATPPDVVRDVEGRELAQPWPEGQYLVRVAATQPARVAELLRAVPRSNRNQFVWRAVAEAALVMPPEHARTLVRDLVRALVNMERRHFFAHTLVDLAIRLAEQRDTAVFDLAEALLWTARRNPDGGTAGTAPESSRPARGRRATAWMLERIEVYDLERFCSKAVPEMTAIDAARTVRLLVRQLDRTVHLAAADEGHVGARESSRWWCEDLTNRGHREDVREILAVAANGAAVTAASAPESAVVVWAELKDQEPDIFARIRLNVLAVAGASLRDELNATIGGDALLDADYGAREAAALLRAQFANASAEAKRVFQYAIERGPDPESVAAQLRWRRERLGRTEEPVTDDTGDEVEATGVQPIPEGELEEELRSAREEWQRTRLRWFHDRLPPELANLAIALGVTPAIPSARQQGLDEVGYYSSGGAQWVVERSPLDVESFAAMGDEEIAAYLASWKPGSDRFEGPSPGGLSRAAQEFAQQHPQRAVRIAMLAHERGAPDSYVAALVRGLRDRDKATALDPAALRALAEFGRSIASRPALEDHADGEATDAGQAEMTASEGRETTRVLCQLLEHACNENRIGEVESASLWAFVESTIRSPSTWIDTRQEDATTFEAITIAAINTLGGEVTDLLIATALVDYRRLSKDRDDVIVPEVENRLAPLLDHVLEQTGRAALGAEMLLGQYAPQLLLIVPEWVRANLPRLFDDGAREPHRRPAWGGYITGSRIFKDPFETFRPWYVQAAMDASSTPAASRGGVRSVTEGLGMHMIDAVVMGLAAVGDSDRLVEQTFDNLPVKDRVHSYWAVFRGWTDAESPPPPDPVARILAFWEWRVGVLEAAAQTENVAEEAEGLAWFVATPYLPALDVIRLGSRTLALLERHRRTTGTMWERLGEIAQEAPAESFALTELLLRNAFRESYVYLPFEQVAPALRAALNCDDASVRERATRAVNDLGAKGHLEFGKLLTEAGPPAVAGADSVDQG